MNKNKIKFRAWDIKNKFMYEVMGISQLIYDKDCEGEPEWKHSKNIEEIAIRNQNENITYEKPLWVKIDNFILMQYTGLRDKHGKEIYEGDIIKHRKLRENETMMYGMQEFLRGEAPTEVKYDQGGFDPINAWIGGAFKDLDYEIIGNIYENPELL